MEGRRCSLATLATWLYALSGHYLLLVLVFTVLFPVAILALGLVMELFAQAITTVLAFVTGPLIAFGIRTYATYIGTVIHELSHATFAFFTGAKVNKITLIPHGATLGSVEYTPRGNKFLQGVQQSLSAVAPTLVGTALLYLMFSQVHPLLTEAWHYVLFYYLALSILFHMDLSIADLRNFFAGILPFLGLTFLCMLLFFGVLGTDVVRDFALKLMQQYGAPSINLTPV